MRYTDTQKREAVALYLEHGTAEASRQTGITGRSIIRWANATGVSQDKAEQTEAAREALALKNQERREHIRERILIKAEDMLDRMDIPHTDFKVVDKHIEQVEWDAARSGDVKNYAVSFAILIDKYRLEMGESTVRTEVTIGDAVQVVRDEVAQMREKRAQ